MDELDLLMMHVAALFRHDHYGRLLHVNDVGHPPAPRFYLGRCHRGVIWRFGTALSAPLVDELVALCRDEPCIDDLQTPPRHASQYCALLSPVAEVRSGPAYVIRPAAAPSCPTVRIRRANADLLEGTFDDWIAEIDARQPFFGVLHDNQPVALCASARITPHACEAGVETLPAYRGRGFAARVVNAWAVAVAESGAIPLYSTGWTNAASRRVAAKLALQAYGCDYQIS